MIRGRIAFNAPLSALALLALASACARAEPGSANTAADTARQPAALSAAPDDGGEPALKRGPYLGQKLPGEEPEPFGRGFMSGQFHSAPSFSPEGDEFWWAGSFSGSRIYASALRDGAWTAPSIFLLPGGMDFMRDPFISPDGKRLYIISMAALPGSNTGGKENLWMSERISGKWSEAAPLPPAVNELAMHWTVSVAENYNLYFSAATERPDNDLYLSRWADGRYQKPERLPQPLNSDNNEYTPNIAPDESYILFSRFRGHSDTPRLYVSYSAQNGWSEPKLVENVPYCISPVVTPDRAYVIFLSSASSLSWRNTAFIEDLRATR